MLVVWRTVSKPSELHRHFPLTRTAGLLITDTVRSVAPHAQNCSRATHAVWRRVHQFDANEEKEAEKQQQPGGPLIVT